MVDESQDNRPNLRVVSPDDSPEQTPSDDGTLDTSVTLDESIAPIDVAATPDLGEELEAGLASFSFDVSAADDLTAVSTEPTKNLMALASGTENVDALEVTPEEVRTQYINISMMTPLVETRKREYELDDDGQPTVQPKDYSIDGADDAFAAYGGITKTDTPDLIHYADAQVGPMAEGELDTIRVLAFADVKRAMKSAGREEELFKVDTIGIELARESALGTVATIGSSYANDALERWREEESLPREVASEAAAYLATRFKAA